MIQEIKGNLFLQDFDMIVHQTNCRGIMGAGFALQIKERYPEVYKQYREDYRLGNLGLGYTGFYKTKDGKWVANMCAQDNYGRNGIFTDYIAFQVGMNAVAKFAYNYELKKIAIPGYIGCGLAGGDWNKIKSIITTTYENDMYIEQENIDFLICYL